MSLFSSNGLFSVVGRFLMDQQFPGKFLANSLSLSLWTWIHSIIEISRYSGTSCIRNQYWIQNLAQIIFYDDSDI